MNQEIGIDGIFPVCLPGRQAPARRSARNRWYRLSWSREAGFPDGKRPVQEREGPGPDFPGFLQNGIFDERLDIGRNREFHPDLHLSRSQTGIDGVQLGGDLGGVPRVAEFMVET